MSFWKYYIRKTQSGWRIGTKGLDGRISFFNAFGDTFWEVLWKFIKLKRLMKTGKR